MSLLVEVEALIRVPGVHCWPAAPDAVAHLRTPHRHLFAVRGRMPVAHTDRDVEFLLLAQRMRDALRRFPALPCGALDFGTRSCEDLALLLIDVLGLVRCGVWEDDENGAIVTRTPM